MCAAQQLLWALHRGLSAPLVLHVFGVIIRVRSFLSQLGAELRSSPVTYGIPSWSLQDLVVFWGLPFVSCGWGCSDPALPCVHCHVQGPLAGDREESSKQALAQTLGVTASASGEELLLQSLASAASCDCCCPVAVGLLVGQAARERGKEKDTETRFWPSEHRCSLPLPESAPEGFPQPSLCLCPADPFRVSGCSEFRLQGKKTWRTPWCLKVRSSPVCLLHLLFRGLK